MIVIIFIIIIVIFIIGSNPLMKFIEHHKLKSLHKIEQNGIEAEAIVTKITSYYDRDMNHKTYITHVKFIGDDNNEHVMRSKILLNLQPSF